MLENSRGLTLIELVVVLAIVAGAAVLALPRLGDLNQTSQIKSAARKLTAIVRLARSEAITRAERLTLDLDLKSGRVSLAGLGEKALVNEKFESPGRLAQVVLRRKPAKKDEDEDRDEPEEKDKADQAALIFEPDGRVSEAVIYLGPDKRSGLTLHLEPLTGRVEVIAGWVVYEWS